MIRHKFLVKKFTSIFKLLSEKDCFPVICLHLIVEIFSIIYAMVALKVVTFSLFCHERGQRRLGVDGNDRFIKFGS